METQEDITVVDGVNEEGNTQGAPIQNGKGSYKHADGSEYNGDWKDGKRHGYGIFKNKTHIYEGEWVEDAPHGKVCIFVYSYAVCVKMIYLYFLFYFVPSSLG